MSIEVVMPKLGLTMAEGVITKWHKKEGELVNVGDDLFDVETDKLVNTIQAREKGILLKILVKNGQAAPVKQPVAIIGEEGESIDMNPNAENSTSSLEPANTSTNTSKPSGEKYDVIVIGGGPGGYVAAIRASQLGAKVLLVEKENLGGTCLNVGCIPTKVLLHTAELYEEMLNSQMYGIKLDGSVSVDWMGLQERKGEIISHLVGGIAGLLERNGIEVVDGQASFIDKNTINVIKNDGNSLKLRADNFIIATGSKPFIPNIKGIDTEGVLDSNEALSLEEIPKELIIVGGGVIGIEFASLFKSFGTKVHVVEMLPYILPPIDREISEMVKMNFEGQGIEIYTSTEVVSIERINDKLEVIAKSGNDEVVLSGDKVLISVGRKAVTEGLNLESIGVRLNRKGIEINSRMETNVDGIYAIGDVTGINMLAHVASEQGMVAAENIMGLNRDMEYNIVPACIYTKPEIASVGMTEEEAKNSGIDYKVGKFMLSNNSKAVIANEFNGTMVKVITDKKYDEILGVHLFGPRATELIMEGALGLRLEATLDEIITTIHPHPTVAEGIKEACLAVNNNAIHAAP